MFSRYGADVNSMSDTGSTPGIYFTFSEFHLRKAELKNIVIRYNRRI